MLEDFFFLGKPFFRGYVSFMEGRFKLSSTSMIKESTLNACLVWVLLQDSWMKMSKDADARTLEPNINLEGSGEQ